MIECLITRTACTIKERWAESQSKKIKRQEKCYVMLGDRKDIHYYKILVV